MSFIARSTIDELNERLDALAVAEQYVRMEKRGGRYWGRCPFHAGGNERTPSFTVDPDRKLYHCFGCGKGGGMVGFVMEMEKTDFPETIKSLAQRFSVPIVYENGAPGDEGERAASQSRKEQLLDLLRRAAGVFSHFLLERPEGARAREYLASRGIGAGTIARFRLGYAPADRLWLYKFLRSKNYSPEFLRDSGLFSTNHPESAFFWDRLMFPIADRQGRAVAFGGRALPGAAQMDGRDPPKYINSRENEVYKKSQILFGLDVALAEIRRGATAYVVEGYMDALALHEAGAGRAVAPCGTAFTEEQAKLLRNWAETAVLVFDSDEAGMKAADKSIVICRKNGLACKVVVPGMEASGAEGSGPDNAIGASPGDASSVAQGDYLGAAKAIAKDPADILQKFGADALKTAMESTIVDIEYLIDRGKSLYDTASPRGKAAALARLYPYLDALGSLTERNACLEAAADALRADREAAKADYARRKEPRARDGADSENEGGQAGKALRMNDELFLLTLVAVNPELYARFRSSVGMDEIEDSGAKEIFVALEECFARGESGAEAVLQRVTMKPLRDFVIERGVSPEFRASETCDPGKLMRDGIRRIRIKRLRRRLAEISGELRLAEGRLAEDRSGAEQDLDELIAEKMRLDAEIRELEHADGKVYK
ncbi:MAG: DNA primase [Treponema sp.]|nr:DNA primase [Treponema sp.]